LTSTTGKLFLNGLILLYTALTRICVLDRLLGRFTPEERKNIGIHTCPGGDCDSVHSFDVDYHELLPLMFQFVSLL
jgi:hypothetical protein